MDELRKYYNWLKQEQHEYSTGGVTFKVIGKCLKELQKYLPLTFDDLDPGTFFRIKGAAYSKYIHLKLSSGKEAVNTVTGNVWSPAVCYQNNLVTPVKLVEG